MSEITKLRELLKEKVAGVADLEISSETLLRADLGLDSLRLVDIMVHIEEKFNIMFDESDLNPSSLRSVGDLVNLIKMTLLREQC